MPYNKKIEAMLWNFETTAKTDYRTTEITAPIKTVYQEKQACHRIRPPGLKNIHTLMDWNGTLPFDLMVRPKDIVRTDPWVVQKTMSKVIDTGRAHAIKTRPRFVMTPAVSMDEIQEPDRDVIIQDIYVSTSHRAMAEAVQMAHYKNIKAPLVARPAPANPVRLNRLQASLVPLEWRRDTVEWESKQLRTFVDPDRDFWRRRDLYKSCAACKATVQVAKIRKLQKRNK